MPHQIITRYKDGSEDSRIEILTVPDLVRHITRELAAENTVEVVIRPLALDEASSLKSLEEVLDRMQSPAALEAAAKLFEKSRAARRR